MTRVTRIVLVVLLLQITPAGNFTSLAQTRQPAPVAAPAQLNDELKQFDDFVARQMKLDRTPGLTSSRHQACRTAIT